MKYVQLGKRGPTVSTIGFGAWAIGGMNWGPTDDEQSKRALSEALDHGVTLIDTADVYGFGHSERLIAEVIETRGKGNVIIATKAGNDFYHSTAADDRGYGPIRQNADRDYIIWAAEQSLKRLKLEAIDILQLHSPDTEKLLRPDPWEALERLKQQGKIRYAGWSVQSFKETEQAFLLDQYHELIDCIQVRYNLLEREAERVLFPKAMAYGIGVIVRIPLLFGLLTGKFDRNSRFREDDHRRFNLSPEKLEHYLAELERWQPLFDRYPDQTMGQVSLRFCLSHPACHTAIPGAKNSQQVQENCAASDFGPIPREVLSGVQRNNQR
ncbi:MAG: aldo/keto reductase [candidate division KSB1 bacterium]|nr:aldo/keto reductase [candidate division KSB1 bacterium]MDZ7334258.1 aldo/keto reductase [candidate division KSB1 bacterium]MDZ7356344.1 aldo/keto reductase [candidate division KSB1 bacterium]MDZ7401036.1 aldo/keto reductase [candidate division KSB1 bacterium]